jgi:hypothetical protein
MGYASHVLATTGAESLLQCPLLPGGMVGYFRVESAICLVADLPPRPEPCNLLLGMHLQQVSVKGVLANHVAVLHAR